VVGANFTFGRRGAGTAGTLRELGIRHGFTTYSVSLVHEVETRCSSTAVRECLRRGDIHCAARVLGRPHRVEGTLQPAGAAMSELRTAPGTALPGPGRYLGRLGGAGSVAVSVTGEARLLVEYPSMRPSWGSVEFTGDSQGLVAVFERA
jgi:riboflavin kinase/FMN adenylyltransferase